MSQVLIPKKFKYEEEWEDSGLDELELHNYRTNSQYLNKVNVIRIADTLKFLKLTEIDFSNTALNRYVRYPLNTTVQILKNKIKGSKKIIALFSFGVIIFWYISREVQQEILNLLRPIYEKIYDNIHEEEFEIFAGINNQKLIQDYVFYLQNESDQDYIILSYTLAQKVLIQQIHNKYIKHLQKFEKITSKLAKYGKLKLSPQGIYALIGQNFLILTKITSRKNFLDIPVMFDSKERLQNYKMLANYFMIPEMHCEIVDGCNAIIDFYKEMLQQKRTGSFKNQNILLVVCVIFYIFLLFYKISFSE